jgi:GNAT superfamily N-acetyltransferase
MLEITQTAASDEADWRGLWHDYLAFYETALPEKIYANSFARLVDPSVSAYHGLIARADGVAVGIANYLFHCHGWVDTEVCYLQDLFVAPGARGTGAGRALLQAVYAAADTAGRPEVYWTTDKDNTRARRLYDEVGEVTPFIKYRRPRP